MTDRENLEARISRKKAVVAQLELEKENIITDIMIYREKIRRLEEELRVTPDIRRGSEDKLAEKQPCEHEWSTAMPSFCMFCEAPKPVETTISLLTGWELKWPP